MDDNSDKERRRLLSAPYRREGDGLDPAEEQRLTELLRSAHRASADTHPQNDAGTLKQPEKTVALATTAPAQRPRQRVANPLTIAAVAISAATRQAAAAPR